MNSYNEQLMYDFYAKGLSQTEAIKQYADHAVKEIKSTYGWDTDVQVTIKPETKDKNLFSVLMCVFGLDEPIVVKKDGKHVLSVLRKVRKTIMRQIQRISERKIKKQFSKMKKNRAQFQTKNKTYIHSPLEMAG